MFENIKMKLKATNIADALSKYLFLPTQFDYKKTFSGPLRVIVIVLFLSVLILAFPPLADWFIARKDKFTVLSSISANQQKWKDYLSYAALFIEIIVAILIGGSIFSEWVAKSYKDLIKQYEDKIMRAREAKLVSMKENWEKILHEHITLIRDARFSNLLQTLPKLYTTANEFLKQIYGNIGKTNMRFIIAKAMIAFPGGLYGLLAFVFFYALCIIKVLIYYCERI